MRNHLPDMTLPWADHSNRPNRPGTPSMPGDNLDPQELASLRALLSDGEWHSRNEITEAISGRFNFLLLDALVCAEDDHGSFWCIPTDDTPPESPSEYATRHGLPSGAALMADAYQLVRLLRDELPAEVIAKETGILPGTVKKYARILNCELQTYENYLQPELQPA